MILLVIITLTKGSSSTPLFEDNVLVVEDIEVKLTDTSPPPSSSLTQSLKHGLYDTSKVCNSCYNEVL